MTDMGTIAGIGLALYAGHHVGDYWIQTDNQAKCKGMAEGAKHCLAHVSTYLLTQALCITLLVFVSGEELNIASVGIALAVSGGTHYIADRREYGIMFRLARLLPGKANFLVLGVPRKLTVHAQGVRLNEDGRAMLDNPSLGTGAWALDQSWHIFWGVFVAALIASI